MLKNDVISKPFIDDISKIFNFQFPKRKMVLIKPLTVCNITCKYCYYEINTNLRDKKLSSLVEMTNAIDKLDLNQDDYVFLSGGEFVLHPKSLDIAKYVREKAFIILSTNGVGLDKYKEILSEVNAVQVSLDSVTSDYHEEFRGKQKETIESIKFLKENDINTSIIVVLSKKNMDEFEDILAFALDHKLDGLFIQLMWLPKDHSLYNDLVPNDNDLKTYSKIKQCLKMVQNKLNIPQDFYLDLLERAITDNLGNYAIKNCFGMNNLLIVDPYNNINHCLPTNLIKNSKDYPNTSSIGVPFENDICKYFSKECLCFFGQLTMNYKKR